VRGSTKVAVDSEVVTESVKRGLGRLGGITSRAPLDVDDQGTECGGTGLAVRSQPLAPLERDDGRLGLGAKGAVDGDVVAARHELPLQRLDRVGVRVGRDRCSGKVGATDILVRGFVIVDFVELGVAAGLELRLGELEC
jgi:hypothetical protein